MDAAYLGVFGNDEIAEHIKASLSDLGVEIDHCITKDGESGFCDVRLEDGDRLFEEWNEGTFLQQNTVIGEEELNYLS